MDLIESLNCSSLSRHRFRSSTRFPLSERPHAARPVLEYKLLRYALLGYIFLLPVQFAVSDTLRAAPSDLFLFVFLFFGLTHIRFVPSAWSVFHVALVGIFLLGTIRTALDNPQLRTYVVLNKDIGIVVLFASYAMITTVARRWSDIRWILRNFVVAVVLQTALASTALFVVQLRGISLPWINFAGTRLSGFLVDPNAFGGLLDVALIIHAVTYFSRRPLIRGSFGVLCMVVLSGGLVLTLSRSAWIGFFVACIPLVALRPRLAVRILMIAALALLVVFLILGSDKSQSLTTVAERSNTVQARVDQAVEALPLIAMNPILGTGLGGFSDRFGWIIHDTALWMLTDFGLLGLTVFLCFGMWFLVQGRSAYQLSQLGERPVVLGLLCAHLSMLGFSVGIEAWYQRHWWVVMALLASTLPVARKNRRLSLKRSRRGDFLDAHRVAARCP